MTFTTIDSVKKMLPKIYRHRKQLLLEIMAVMSQYKHLEPVLDRFVFNDGTVKTLISLVGTVAVVYQGNIYNIPLCLWLEESYPHSAPICYVKPTREMNIIPSRHVNSNGQILLPYLDEWRHIQCDLHSLIQVIMAVFGEVPPLCIQPDSPKQPPRATQACFTDNSQITLQREDGSPLQGKNESNC